MFRNWNLFFSEEQLVCASPGFAELMLFLWLSPSFRVCAAMPSYLCNVASWAVVQSDVQPSKSLLKAPAVTYESMRIHWAHVTVCHPGEVATLSKEMICMKPMPFLSKFKIWEAKAIWPALILPSSSLKLSSYKTKQISWGYRLIELLVRSLNTGFPVPQGSICKTATSSCVCCI